MILRIINSYIFREKEILPLMYDCYEGLNDCKVQLKKLKKSMVYNSDHADYCLIHLRSEELYNKFMENYNSYVHMIREMEENISTYMGIILTYESWLTKVR